jgi:hypothetical protein
MPLATFSGPLTDFGLSSLTAASTTVIFYPHDTGASRSGGILAKDPVVATLSGGTWSVQLYTTDDVFPAGAYYTLEVKRLNQTLWDNPTWKLYAPSGGGNLLDMFAGPDLSEVDRNWADARYARKTEIPALVAAALAMSTVMRDAVAAAVAEQVALLDFVLGDDDRLPQLTNGELPPYTLTDGAGKVAFTVESDSTIAMAGASFKRLPPETGYVAQWGDWAGRSPLRIGVDGTVDMVPSAATIAALGGGRADPRDTGSDVVLILGQSNAQGPGVPFDSSIDIETPGINQYAGSGAQENQVIPAIESLVSVTKWVDGTNGRPRVGPAMEFARQYFYTQPSNRDVLIVPAAQGSTSITGNASYSWDPDNNTASVNLIHRAITKTAQALALNPNNRLVAILWHQGESDSGAMSTAQYRAKLVQIIDLLRSNFGATVPFLVGGMVPEWVAAEPTYRSAIQAALQAIPSNRNYTAYTAGPSGMNQDDLIHYNAAGARELGRRYFAALARARANN